MIRSAYFDFYMEQAAVRGDYSKWQARFGCWLFRKGILQ